MLGLVKCAASSKYFESRFDTSYCLKLKLGSFSFLTQYFFTLLFFLLVGFGFRCGVQGLGCCECEGERGKGKGKGVNGCGLKVSTTPSLPYPSPPPLSLTSSPTPHPYPSPLPPSLTPSHCASYLARRSATNIFELYFFYLTLNFFLVFFLLTSFLYFSLCSTVICSGKCFQGVIHANLTSPFISPLCMYLPLSLHLQH